MNKKSIPKPRGINVFILAMMNVAVIMSLRGIPMMSKERLTMIFYILFAVIVFLIPTSLVSAELATGWSSGGPELANNQFFNAGVILIVFLIVGILFFILTPVIIYHFKKSDWTTKT